MHDDFAEFLKVLSSASGDDLDDLGASVADAAVGVDLVKSPVVDDAVELPDAHSDFLCCLLPCQEDIVAVGVCAD